MCAYVCMGTMLTRISRISFSVVGGVAKTCKGELLNQIF